MDMTMHDGTSRWCLNIEFMSGLGGLRKWMDGRLGQARRDRPDRSWSSLAAFGRRLDPHKAPWTRTRYDIFPWPWGSGAHLQPEGREMPGERRTPWPQASSR